jgi:fatty-acid desaturase
VQLVANHDRKVNSWEYLVQVVVVHVMALGVAPFYFSWDAYLFNVAAMVLFLYPLGMFYHMLLSHRAFRCPKWLEYLGSLLATLAWRGPFAGPVRYVAIHRVHHAYSDTDHDPHSPIHGIAHAMGAWFWRMPEGLYYRENYEQYAADVARDPVHRFMDRNVLLLQAVWALLCFAIGGVPYVLYGVFVKTLASMYVGNLVDWLNHAPHPGGYRNYETSDTSTNSKVMAFMHWGGAVSWHNNHHAKPKYFMVKKNWWEFDLHYLGLRVLQRMGLASDIRVLDETA